MIEKVHQITDGVHGTIFFSKLEYALISTPFLYRLNDVYQSSAVYLTFPSNRTKRYEHSLGVMHLTSKAFYYNVTNANCKTRKYIFDQLTSALNDIVDRLKAEDNSIFYSQIESQIGNHLLDRDININEAINHAISCDTLRDFSLDHFVPNCFHDGNSKDPQAHIQLSKEQFVYKCAIQAIRIAALFHDVGHPPYSHILEDVLRDLYLLCHPKSNAHAEYFARKDAKKFDETKSAKLLKHLGRFVYPGEKEREMPFLLTTKANILSVDESKTIDEEAASSKIHERIGLKFLELAFGQCLPGIIGERDDTKSPLTTAASILYYITIVEFVFAILTDKDKFFQTLHRLFDGYIDTDKQDYIVRDTKNSGVNWGTIPYERILEAAKFDLVSPSEAPPDSKFAVSYPQKVADDLDDIMITRFKVFSRINFHHRCIKTSQLIKAAVRELAIDYLENSDANNVICNEIETLWSALGNYIGTDRRNIRVMQWNDSWLITMLYSAFVKLYEEHSEVPSRKKIFTCLNEVLLNKKHYYSLLKRKSDTVKLAKIAIEHSGLTKEKIVGIIEQLRAEKYANFTSGAPNNANDVKIKRLNLFKGFINGNDFDLLENALNIDLEKTIRDSLIKIQKDNALLDFKFEMNKGRDNIGPKDGADNIYLYDQYGTAPYDIKLSLENRLNSLRSTCLGFTIYICFEDHVNNILDSIQNVFQIIGEDIGSALSNSFDHRNDPLPVVR